MGLVPAHWVVAKLGITVVASILLLVHMQIASRMADVVSGATLAAGDFRGMRIQLVADAAGAVVVLLLATALSVFKPQGLTPYGRRELGVECAPAGRTLPWGRILGILTIALIAFAVVKHLAGGGLHHH